jgi:NADH-quinone oxidoreductase subunit J
MFGMLVSFYFYMFSIILVAASIMVIASKSPVHSVFFLILAFFNSAGLFLIIGAEFVAMVLVIVYVGAVAVLCLFGVMMLDVDVSHLRASFVRYLPVGGLVGLVLLLQLITVLAGSFAEPLNIAPQLALPDETVMENTKAIGSVLYTKYFLAFQAPGLVLFVAMIGAILLTLRTRPGVKRQTIADQVERTVEA